MLCLLLPWKRVTKIDLGFVYNILISVPRGLVFFVFTRLIPRLTNFQTFRCVLRTLSSIYDAVTAEIVEIAFTEIVHLIKKNSMLDLWQGSEYASHVFLYYYTMPYIPPL